MCAKGATLEMDWLDCEFRSNTPPSEHSVLLFFPCPPLPVAPYPSIKPFFAVGVTFFLFVYFEGWCRALDFSISTYIFFLFSFLLSPPSPTLVRSQNRLAALPPVAFMSSPLCTCFTLRMRGEVWPVRECVWGRVCLCVRVIESLYVVFIMVWHQSSSWHHLWETLFSSPTSTVFPSGQTESMLLDKQEKSRWNLWTCCDVLVPD